MSWIPPPRFFLVLFILLVFVSLHSPTRSMRGASISLRLAHMSWWYCTIPRKCFNFLMLLGRFSTSITCTFFDWGLIPLWSVYNQGFYLMCTEQWLAALTLSPASCNLVSTVSIFWRCSSSVPLVMINKSSMYACTNLRCHQVHYLGLKYISWASKAHGESLIWVLSPKEDDCTHLRRCWVQPDGVVAHVKIKGCGISEAS